MNKHWYLFSPIIYGLHNTFWSVLTSIISKKVYSLGSKDASCTLNEYNSVSAESVLSVHTPIINLTSSMEFSIGNFSLFALAYSIIACWSIVNILSVLLGRRMKSAFVAVGKLPSTLTYNPASSDCQSNWTW